MFILCIDRMGLRHTTRVLEKQVDTHRLQNNPDADFVLKMVSRTFKVPVEEIRIGVTRKNERIYAIGFCAYYLHCRFGYGMKQVGTLLRKTEWTCYKYANLIQDLDPKSARDKHYVAWRKLFDKKVQEFLKSKEKNI